LPSEAEVFRGDSVHIVTGQVGAQAPTQIPQCDADFGLGSFGGHAPMIRAAGADVCSLVNTVGGPYPKRKNENGSERKRPELSDFRGARARGERTAPLPPACHAGVRAGISAKNAGEDADVASWKLNATYFSVALVKMRGRR
jgi:hypothetical protein